jgi:hypothetical protein
MAAPHVAGAAALLLETDQNLSPQEVAQELRKRATPYVVKADKGSHNLLLHTGDGPMISYTTSTTTTTPVVWGDDPWVVAEGPCTIDAEGCAKREWYGNDEFCKILVNDTSAMPISVKKFSTEHGYDSLTVNGVAYSGAKGPEGIIPQGVITWQSDYSLTAPGWQICMPAATTHMTTTGAVTTTTEDTTSTVSNVSTTTGSVSTNTTA